MKRPLLVGLAAAAVLVADVTTVLVHDDGPDLAWDARVKPLAAFVESHRGLRFDHPVEVSFLSDAEFEKHVTPPPAETEEDEQELADAVAQFRALGLLRGPLDLRKAYGELTAASVIGLYVSEDEAVYVRGTELTPSVRVTLVHELTHALQDQHFDLEQLQDDAPGGDTTALTALIEGDAVRIEEQYRDALDKVDRRTYQQEQQKGFAAAQARTSAVPAVLQDFLGFPYVFGPVLLDELVDRDGNDEVDRAFGDPPTSEAQVLDPVGYPWAQDPVEVPVPTVPEGAKAFGDPGPFGQVFLFDVLGSQLGYQEAWEAVQGWRGDQFVGYRKGSVVCAAADIRMVDDRAATRLEQTGRRWAARVPGATVQRSGQTVELRSCDPGTAGRPLVTQDPSAFDVLVVRAQILHEVTRSGAPHPVAVCLVAAVVEDASRDGYRALTDERPSPGTIAHIQQVVAQAAARCRATAG